MNIGTMCCVVALGCCASISTAALRAQMPSMDSAKSAAKSKAPSTDTARSAMSSAEAESPAAAFDEPLSLFEHDVVGVAKAMPEDKYSFAPAPGTFSSSQGAKFDGVRTFAAEVTHVAEANYYFYMAISGLKPDVDIRGIETLTKKDEIVDALAKSIAFGHKAVATITLQNAFLPIKPVDGMKTRASLAAFAVAHGYDHYGQIVEYMRMNGVIPPGSK